MPAGLVSMGLFIPGVQEERTPNRGKEPLIAETAAPTFTGLVQHRVGSSGWHRLEYLIRERAGPSVDVIGGLWLTSNPYTAEYGRSPGAVADVITRPPTADVFSAKLDDQSGCG
jgi:hypothetical protein